MITIDDSYEILPDKLRGRKPKFKLKSKDGKLYIFKYGTFNNEIFAELIAEQLGKQAGIEMAHYQVAEYKGIVGVLTDFFLQPTEYIISSDKLKLSIQEIYNENNINISISENTITNLVLAATMYDDRVNPEQLIQELMLRWCFHGLIMERDKNETNIGFIKGNQALRLTPDYDNSSMASLDENISNYISSLMQGQSFYGITSGFRSNLKINRKDTGDFIVDFALFCQKYPQQAQYCMERLNKIDPEQAFTIVETENEISLPWEVQFWVSKTVSARLRDMNEIYKQKVMKKN